MPRLKRVSPESDNGLQRVRSGAGFRYLCQDGRPATPADRARIDGLVIPPAWSDVWICASPRGHIQVVGTDEAGRRQYLYHPDWIAKRERGKYDRALDLAAALPRARARVTRALNEPKDEQEWVLAVAFRLLDLTALRVGSRRHLRRTGSRGLTTLQGRHVLEHESGVTLAFPGKSGKRQAVTVEDERMVEAIRELVGGPRAFLLRWREGRRYRSLTPEMLNTYIGEVTGSSFSAKDFRTLTGTVLAAEALARAGVAASRRERTAIERQTVQYCAQRLGNTVAVARRSYIDPRVFERYRQGRLLDTQRSPGAAVRDLILGA